MSKPPDVVIHLSETLTLCEYQSPKNGSFGFWLYDETQGMNLAVRAKSEREAFVDALNFYQTYYKQEKEEHTKLAKKVAAFVSQFVEPEDVE